MITFFLFSPSSAPTSINHTWYTVGKEALGLSVSCNIWWNLMQKNKGNFETKQLVLCLSVCDLHVWCTNENKRAMRGFERIKKTICRLFFFLLNMLFDWLHLCAAAKMCSQGGAVYHYPHKFWIPWIALHVTKCLKRTALNRKPQ